MTATPASGMPHTPAQEASVCFAPYGHSTTACRVTIPKHMPWNFADGDWDSPGLTTRRAETTCTRCLARFRDAPEAANGTTQPGAGDPETSGTGSDRGTGEPRLQISTQGIEGEPLTGSEIISRTLVLAFGTRHHDRPFIKEIAEALDAALRPVHYREAASSIRSVADGMTYAWQATDAKGMRRAANLLDSTAHDLDEEAGR